VLDESLSASVVGGVRGVLDKRAEAAVVARMRHHTTGYDGMHSTGQGQATRGPANAGPVEKLVDQTAVSGE
jgi:hypothetical protein